MLQLSRALTGRPCCACRWLLLAPKAPLKYAARVGLLVRGRQLETTRLAETCPDGHAQRQIKCTLPAIALPCCRGTRNDNAAPPLGNYAT